MTTTYNNLSELIKDPINNISHISYNTETKTYTLNTNLELQDIINDISLVELNILLDEDEIFNGNGYTIYLNNLSINGLFKVNTNNSNRVLIKNLSLYNGNITENNGCFVGNGQSKYIIKNCRIQCELENNNTSGFSGKDNSDYIIEKCFAKVIISGIQCGGFISSNNSNYKIQECLYQGTITGSNNGGFVSPNNNTGHITNCISICNINNNNSGFVGFLDSTENNIVIQNSYHKGNIDSDSKSFGYLNSNNISNSYDNINISDINNGKIGELNTYDIISINDISYESNIDSFIIDNFDFNSYPILKCFRELPWMKDDYEHYINSPSLGSTISDFINSGYTENELKDYGITIEEFRLEGYTITELVEIGFTLKQIMDGGYTTAQLISEGYTMAMVLEDVIEIENITYGINNENIITKDISGNNIIYNLTRNINWSDINGITDNADFFTLKKNEIFDGNGFYIDLSGVSTRGIFKTEGSSITNAPIIKNLNIINGNISHNDFYDHGNALLVQKEQRYFIIDNCTINSNIYGEFSGGFAGMYSGYESGYCIIKNCNFEGIIYGNHSGGIIGSGGGNTKGRCEIINCGFSGRIIGKGSGGIAGFACGNSSGNCIINNCFSRNIIIEGECAGGIIGSHAGNRGYCLITDSDTSGNIIGNWSGGITGYNAGYKGNCDIYGCYYSGSMSGEYNGGITGLNAGYMGKIKIELSNTSNINILGSGSGGITGGNSGIAGSCDIIKCYTTNGTINSSECGGIVGSYSGKLDGSCNITSCYSELTIDGSNNGGLCGSYAGYQGITNINKCYYNGNISGNNNGGFSGSYSGNKGQIIIENSYVSGNISSTNYGFSGIYSGSTNGNYKLKNSFSISTAETMYGNNTIDNNGLLIIQNSYVYSTSGNSEFIDDISSNGNIVIQNSYVYNTNGTSKFINSSSANSNIVIQNSFDDTNINPISLTVLNNDVSYNNIINDGESFVIDDDSSILLNDFLNVPWKKEEYNITTGPRLGFIATDLSNSGYIVNELTDYGFTATEISKIGYPIRELLELGAYKDNELNIAEYLNENIDISTNLIREDFKNYGHKFSLDPLVDSNLVELFRNKMITTTQQTKDNIDKILFVLTDKLVINDNIREFLNNQGYIYLEGTISEIKSFNVNVIQNRIEIINGDLFHNIKYNGATYSMDDIINMNSMTVLFYGVGVDDDDENIGSVLLRGELNGSTSGDPHIYPVDGGMKYELPNKKTNYRLVQSIRNDLIINCSTRNITEKEKYEIKEFYKIKNNKEAPDTLQTEGVFYKEIYMNIENNKLYYNFDTKNIKIIGNKEYFSYNVGIKKGNKENKNERCEYIKVLNISFNHSYYGLIVLELNYFSNPQLKYGIKIQLKEIDNLNELSGLLIREYNCKYLELNNIQNKSYRNVNNKRALIKNKVNSYHLCY
jgi:hypothetical protein